MVWPAARRVRITRSGCDAPVPCVMVSWINPGASAGSQPGVVVGYSSSYWMEASPHGHLGHQQVLCAIEERPCDK